MSKKTLHALGSDSLQPEWQRDQRLMAVQEPAQAIGVAASCRALSIPRATLYRRRRLGGKARQGTRPRHPRRLADEEERDVLAVLHSPRFVDRAPAEVVATLLDEGRYLCSERTMYRLLARNREVRERRNQLRHPAYKKPELLATGPNQVWSTCRRRTLHTLGADSIGAPSGAIPQAERRSRFRPRDPSATPLYRLIARHYETVKACWEERFEDGLGFWRGFVDDAVNRYLDCGLFEHGFARVQCGGCHHEFLVAFSCKGRGLCSSCGAKRAAEFAAFLADEVLEEVDHDQWVFTLPKMLRPYFMRQRELLGDLCRLAYDTVLEMMAAVVPEEEGFRPGMVAVVQTFGARLNPDPHVHAIVSRGGWTSDGRFLRISYLDAHAAELVFRHKVLRLLSHKGLIGEDRIELLLSWRHSGFSVHNAVGVDAEDRQGLERLCRYFLRSPVSLERLSWDETTDDVRYALKGSPRSDPHDTGEADALELVARIINHIPEPRRHLARYYGAYSSVARSRRRAARSDDSPLDDSEDSLPTEGSPSLRRRQWADLIRRVYEEDPLLCPHCGETMRIISFITDHRVARKILEHLGPRYPGRAPPPPDPQVHRV